VTSATWKLEFPYKRSVGPVIGGFLTGLRERRVLGAATSAGRVLVPPLEYDPETGEPTGQLREVGQSGVVEHATWVDDPLSCAPFDRPFAYALVRLDGADTAMLHALDVPEREAARAGMRVKIRWRAETTGHLTDIECFEPEDAS
jgi:uncharacterized OB-fold protein